MDDATRRHIATQRELSRSIPLRDDRAGARFCGACGAEFDVTKGERAFAEATGLALATRCLRCRPTRRQALAAGVAR